MQCGSFFCLLGKNWCTFDKKDHQNFLWLHIIFMILKVYNVEIDEKIIRKKYCSYKFMIFFLIQTKTSQGLD